MANACITPLTVIRRLGSRFYLGALILTLIATDVRADGLLGARLDVYGDPLPPRALARLGTVRFRQGGFLSFIACAPDGNTLITREHPWDDGNGTCCVWNAGSGTIVRQFRDHLPAPYSSFSALSKDGQWLATSGKKENDWTLDLWSVASGQCTRRLPLAGQLIRVEFALDGKTLASIANREISVWNVATGDHQRTWRVKDWIPRSVAFTADNKRLISGGSAGIIRLWDVATGRELRRWAGAADTAQDVKASADGRHVASLAWHGIPGAHDSELDYCNPADRLHIWNVETTKEVHQLVRPKSSIKSFDFSPDGKLLATGHANGLLCVWELARGKELRHFQVVRGRAPNQMLGSADICALAFSADGKSIAVADSHAIYPIDANTGVQRVSLTGHTSVVTDIVATPDGRTVVTSGVDNMVHTWDATSGQPVRNLRVDGTETRLLMANDGRVLVAVADQKYHVVEVSPPKIISTLCVLDHATGKPISTLPDPSFRPVAVSADGEILAHRTVGHGLRLVSLKTGKEVSRLDGQDSSFIGVSFAPDGRTIFTWDQWQIFHAWKIKTGRETQRFGMLDQELDDKKESYINCVAMSPDARLVACSPHSKFIVIVDRLKQKRLRRFDNLQNVCDIAFSPDGNTIAWASWQDATIRVGEIATGQVRMHFVGHQGQVCKLVFSADGKKLISGASDTSSLVWDVTGQVEPIGAKASRPAAAEFNACWAELDRSAAAAFPSMRRLMAYGAEAVAFLKPRLRPAAGVTDERLRALLKALDSDSFAARENAGTELALLGELAEPALRQALANRPSVEFRQRAQRLLLMLDAPLLGERLRQWRALEVLEHIGSQEARQALQTIACGAATARLTEAAKAALDRLAKRDQFR